MQEPPRIFIVVDHSLVRQGLRHLLECDAGMLICGEAKNIHESLPLIKKLAPDVVVVDISLSDGSGLDLIKRINAINSNVAILVLSMHNDEVLYAERALRAGAMAYVNKNEAPENIVQAVQRILKGKIYLSERMTEHLLHNNFNNHRHDIDINDNDYDNDYDKSRQTIDNLSNREVEIFMQVGEGYSTAQIAVNLNLSKKTIETHKAHIKQKLGLDTANELARLAVQWTMEKA